MVEGCELGEPVVEVPVEAPVVGHVGPEWREARAAAANDDMGCRVESPAVMVGSVLDTPILIDGAGALVAVDVTENS